MRYRIPSLCLLLVTVGACSEPVTPTAASGAVARVALQQGPNTNSNVNVTSTVSNADAAGQPLLTRSDNPVSGGLATYSTYSGVSSIVSNNGAWQLYLGNQSQRTLYLVLSSQGVRGVGGSLLPDGYYSANTEGFSRCFDASNTVISTLTLRAGQSYGNCSFGVDFSTGGTKYKIAMSPLYAGTGRAQVSCLSSDATRCTSWRITLRTDVPNAGVADLFHFAKNGSLVLDGVYRESFDVHLAI